MEHDNKGHQILQSRDEMRAIILESFATSWRNFTTFCTHIEDRIFSLTSVKVVRNHTNEKKTCAKWTFLAVSLYIHKQYNHE